MARNGRVKTRKATWDELQRMVKKSQIEMIYDSIPRSQLVIPKPKEVGNGVGWGFDGGGKYWR